MASKFFGLSMLLFGLAFLAAGLFVRSQFTPDEGDVVVEGVVVSIESSAGSEDGTLYAPVVRYVDPASGTDYQVEGQLKSSSRPTIGDVREVAFPPSSPADGKVVGSLWFPWIFISIGGGVLGLCAIGVGSAMFGGSASGGSRASGNEKESAPQDAIYRGPQDGDGPQDNRGPQDGDGPQDKRTDL